MARTRERSTDDRFEPAARRAPARACAWGWGLAVFASGVALLAATPAAAQERVRILLLPMVVHSAEPPEYLRSGLGDMLASRLERIPDFDVVRLDEPDAGTTKIQKAVKQARKVDARFVLFGSFTRFGTGASLDVQCAGVGPDGDEEPLREIFVHSGSIGDVIPDLDDLVGKVARFVIADYTARVAAETGDVPNLPSNQIQSLEARISALEKALEKLTGKPAGAAAPTASGSGGAAKPAAAGPVAKSP
jgi:TolB-like protein